MKLGIALVLLSLSPRPSFADSTALGAEPDAPSKKDRFLAAKAAAPAVKLRVNFDRLVGVPPLPVINIYNRWTDETIAVDARPAKARGRGRKQPALPEGDVSAERAARFLRCHFTNQPAPHFDPRLFNLVVQAASYFHAARVEIVSGYRAPKYNLMLRKKGRNVARESQHVEGHAVDFRLVGVPTMTLMRWVKKQHLGGVGYYPSSQFVHADTGKVRFWLGE